MILYMDKPLGRTSFDLVKKIRGIIKERKVGHAWTLDPYASGVMIIASWVDTKKIPEYVWMDKTYHATIDFSLFTDTRDLQYWARQTQHLVWEHEGDKFLLKGHIHVPAPSLQKIQEKLDAIIWDTHLPLTPFSAKKYNGKKLYTYARSGNPIFITMPMTVHKYRIVEYNFPLLRLELDVGSWTYIRSIAHRLWTQFWLGWTLIQLRRTSVGNVDIEQCLTLQTLQEEYSNQSI